MNEESIYGIVKYIIQAKANGRKLERLKTRKIAFSNENFVSRIYDCSCHLSFKNSIFQMTALFSISSYKAIFSIWTILERYSGNLTIKTALVRSEEPANQLKSQPRSENTFCSVICDAVLLK